ncbi:ABC transporter substrate-binding protein [Actinocrispum sp. NPDC049592]|uniref:ABC transporter substrate-binding protein n=1 Tax=Actinocrispum sp. NPDC049592 TaxID=3154835 RepID=UPI00343D03DF
MRIRPVAAVLLTAAILGGCTSTPQGSPRDKVSYLTSFNTFGRDAYAYVALDKGYFTDAGIDVTITPGTATVDVLKLVAGGRADFGVGDFTATAITVAKEKLPVTAVAMVHQKSLAAIVTLADRGISKPTDLQGKQIGDQPGSTNQLMFPVYAKAAGIDPNQVKFVPSAPPALPQLLASGQVDAIGQFVVGTPLIEKAAQGRKTFVLPYGDLIPELYGNALVTSKDLAAKNPELVKRFRDALLKGLRYSIDHPDETGQILREYQPTQDPAVAAAEVKLMAPYVRPVGVIDELRVSTTIQLLISAEAIRAGSVSAPDLVSFELAPK